MSELSQMKHIIYHKATVLKIPIGKKVSIEHRTLEDRNLKSSDLRAMKPEYLKLEMN